jgi:alpha-amylase/alpha-mannosidase (GH57 family)
MSENLLILHGHFYQPPRENPWTGLISREPSAAPSHDWNQRVDEECYRPNAYGRILDEERLVSAFVNNFQHMSFNVGPTLLSWLQIHDSLTLRRMVEADRASATRNGGHGNAIAQGFSHMILPLADKRDRATQMHWGLAAFRFHFGREAEAMWLPETAANHEVLDELIDVGMRFVILAPQQAKRIRPLRGGAWKSTQGAKIDTSRPYLYRARDGSGRGLAVFFYDGTMAHELAFGDALHDSGRFTAHALAARERAGKGALVHAAVDGESAGHHQAWGDRVLSHALTRSLPAEGFRVTNYGHALELHPPEWEVELDLGPLNEGSSWSCAHGVGRWIRDCGCRVAQTEGWNQQWRSGLRRAFDILRDSSRSYYEEEAGKLLRDPWAARNDYVKVLLDCQDQVRQAFLVEHARKKLSTAEQTRALSLLEMQHQLMLQYTSCGWFFDDISGLEARQVLRYAARAVDIWAELGGSAPASEFLDALSSAKSNREEEGDGIDIFRHVIMHDTVDPRQILVHALLRADSDDAGRGEAGAWRWTVRDRERHEKGTRVLHSGRVEVEMARVQRRFQGVVTVVEREEMDFQARVKLQMGEEEFSSAARRLGAALAEGNELSVLNDEFTDLVYTSEELLRSGGRELLAPIVERNYEEFRADLARLHHDHLDLLAGADQLGLDDPGVLKGLAQIALEAAFARALMRMGVQGLEDGREAVEKSFAVARSSGMTVDWSFMRMRAEEIIGGLLTEGELGRVHEILEFARRLEIPLYLFRAQELFLEKGAQLAQIPEARTVGQELGLRDELVQAIIEGEV